jgi:RNase P subunit RPR2
MERGFVYNFLVNFLNSADGYTELYTKYLTCGNHMERVALDKRLSAIENALSFSRSNLFQVLNRCRKYVELAYVFRNKIVCQYIKHAYKQAHTYCKAKGTNFELDEVQQSLMAAITKAIDKYDSSKGALTSYINYWILNALTYASSNYGHEYGVAYQIPQTQKKLIQGTKSEHVNFSVSLNDMLDSDLVGPNEEVLVSSSTIEADYITSKEAEDTAYLIKCADPNGLARLYLDLTEFISVKEKQRMLRSMKRQLGYYPEGI